MEVTAGGQDSSTLRAPMDGPCWALLASQQFALFVHLLEGLVEESEGVPGVLSATQTLISPAMALELWDSVDTLTWYLLASFTCCSPAFLHLVIYSYILRTAFSACAFASRH